MGMLSAPAIFSEHFKEDEPFTLEDAKMGPEIQTDFGRSAPALLKIDSKWYSIFGQGIANQVERLETGELPARVMVTRVETKSGQRVKLIVPHTFTKDDSLPF